ncbi:glycosyl transferase family 1 [Mycobacterium numidiamassiliense]|jgi:UDP:flavonoid glycosyltransferase YjiC (YdhE family)|uniref:Glycosyl transferase family 1 n=1 Tax=Mycobacterium numidiamassiliense TaxID=1841861 RepID=A0A2U3PBC9_9MYCO|nr:glycosyltransferase [Mycobacterium numidiamassiliense]SPM41059.1 glycosyl transferase family 1 [Mycobacterium numidiamassiliense]
MKFVLTSWGSRGDVEPCAAVGRELQRRGHEVHVAVPPDLVGFVESVGLAAVAFGLDMKTTMEALRNFWTCLFRHPWRIRNLIRAYREAWRHVTRARGELSTTLMSLADGADLMFTGLPFEQPASNIAEYYDIPLVTLHYIPARANGHLVPGVPAALIRSVMTMVWWLVGLLMKRLDDQQRGELGLPSATGRSSRQRAERGSLEIQAYDEACFPGLAAEWAAWEGQRPFVGSLTMELPTDTDDEVASWIAAGTPPIYFGFGSMPQCSAVDSVTETVAMIAAACEQLGERALVCSTWGDLSDVPHFEHVKVVPVVNFAATFPACRAVVHHGGAGTTAAGLRAGVPTAILWTLPDQPIWGAQLKRQGLGTVRRLSSATQETLVADLRTILAPEYASRARRFASRMSKPADSVTNAADLLENLAQVRRVA